MSTVTEPAERQSPRRQWLTRLAVAFIMVAGFMLGNSLAMGGLPDLEKAGPVWLAWAGFQAVCLLIGRAWAPKWKGSDTSVAGLCWKLKRCRVRMRRRWIGERERQDYYRAEKGFFLAILFFSCFSFIIAPLELKVDFLIAVTTVLMTFFVVPHYRDAPSTLTLTLITSSLLSVAWGLAFAPLI